LEDEQRVPSSTIYKKHTNVAIIAVVVLADLKVAVDDETNCTYPMTIFGSNGDPKAPYLIFMKEALFPRFS